MKTKKVLFTTSGIIKLVASGIVLLIFGLALLLTGVIKKGFLENYDELLNMINELVAEDSQYAYLLELDKVALVDEIMTPVTLICVFFIFMSLTGITFGVFNLVFANKYQTMLMNKTGKKVIYLICMLLFNWGIVTNILTIIALFLKDKQVEITTSEGAIW